MPEPELSFNPEADDGWLTVVEIAEELRVNPATVRLWVSKGRLPATRAGQRKLLVRRSDLTQMLESGAGDAPPTGYQPRLRDPRRPGRMGPPASLSQLSTADVHGRQVSPAEMRDIVDDVQRAADAWEDAQEASDNAPPDPWFPHRIRALAEACDRQAECLARAGWTEGFSWTPQPGSRDMILSYELRPGGNRPGPAALWQEFDRAVQRLGAAMEGQVMYVVAFRYGELAAVMHRIADLLLGETRTNRDGEC